MAIFENAASAAANMRLAPQEVRTYFVTAATWSRRTIFRAQPFAQLFIETLLRYRDQRRYSLHEFVLMPDHFHLLLTPSPDISLERAIQFIKGGFSFRVKRELASNLEIWHTGFTEHRVFDGADYDQHVNYIHQNPVKSRLAWSTEEYPYGSASGTWVLDPRPPWFTSRG